MCTPDEDVHSLWGTSPFPVRMFIPLSFILTGNAHPHQGWRCASPGMHTGCASEIAIKKLLFLGRLITEPNMAPTVRNLFQYIELRAILTQMWHLPEYCLVLVSRLVKYDLFYHFESWYNSFTFPSFENWKRIVRDRIQIFENVAWPTIIQTCILLRPVWKCISSRFLVLSWWIFRPTMPDKIVWQ